MRNGTPATRKVVSSRLAVSFVASGVNVGLSFGRRRDSGAARV